MNTDTDLRQALDAALEEIQQLRKAMIDPVIFPAEWKLSRGETTLLRLLLSRDCATKAAIRLALDYNGTGNPESIANTANVVASHLRKKISRYGLSFHTVQGEGYAMDAPNKARLRDMLEAANALRASFEAASPLSVCKAEAMSLRDWFAGMALSNPKICTSQDEWPQRKAYAFADAMLTTKEVKADE